MVNKYPYTDFHELNLDWFLRQFKTLKAEWAALVADNAEFKVEMTQKFDTLDHTVQTFTTFVSDYFNNLDVQQEINNKLDQMVLDGTLGDLLQPYVDTEVPAAVTAWLDLNVDPVGSAVTIDRTLTISGSAADAKRVGYIKDGFINTLIQVDWTPSTTNGSYIKQDGTGVGSSTKYFRTSSVWLAQNNNRIVIDMTDPSFELSVTWYSNPYSCGTLIASPIPMV